MSQSKNTKRAEIIVRGKVQGVFFRQRAKEAAEMLGLKGWIRNEEDGSVKIVAQGKEDSINKLIAWAKNGPEYAEVENFEIKYLPLEKSDDFEIRY